VSGSSFQLWTQFEESFCISGKLPDTSNDASSANAEAFKAIVRKNDARLADSLAIQKKSDALLALRGQIYRGQHDEAWALSLKMLQGLDHTKDSVRTAEVLLEQARMLAMKGDWSECAVLCDHILDLPEIAPVSQLTIYQLRDNACYELHRMSEALSDLARIDSLASIFPNSPSAFYAEVIRVRILARDQRLELAFRSIDDLWRKLLSTSNANLDRVHALIRAEVDIQATAGSTSDSELTGERLYMALGALEAAHAGNPALSEYFAPIANELARSFPKAKNLLLEIEAGKNLEESVSASASTTGATLVVASRRAPWGSPQDRELIERISQTNFLFLPRHSALIRLEPFCVLMLEEQPQLQKTLLALGQGKLSMKDFFAALWGQQKYSHDLHAHLISSLLHRLKKKTGASARLSAGHITLENTWVLA